MGGVKDLLIKGLLLVAVPWTLYVAPSVHKEVRARQAQRPAEYPQYSDLLPALCVFMALLPAQLLFRKLLTPLVRIVLPKKPRWRDAVWEAKVKRCCDAVFKFYYYVFTSIWGVTILRDTSFLPWPLFGSGETRACWTDGYPFQAVPADLRYFYLVALGYQLSEDAMLLLERRLPDFWEMALHHTVSCALIVVSYMMNYVRVGSLVLLLHNFTDIFIYASKSLVDTSCVRLMALSYVGLVVAYAWFRIYVFPAFVIKTAWVESVAVSGQTMYGWGFLNFALSVLFLLHMYWFGLIVKIGLVFKNTGQARDLQSNLSSMELNRDKKQA